MGMLQKCQWVSSEMTCLWMVDVYVTEVSVSGLRDDMFVDSWWVCYRSVSEWPQRWHVCRQLMGMLQKCQWVSSEMTCLWMVDVYVTEVSVSGLRDDMFVDSWCVCYRSVSEWPQRWHVCEQLMCMLQKCQWVASEMTCLWTVDVYVTEVSVSGLRDDMFVDGWCVCYRSVSEWPQRWHVCRQLMGMLQKCQWVSSEMTCL